MKKHLTHYSSWLLPMSVLCVMTFCSCSKEEPSPPEPPSTNQGGDTDDGETQIKPSIIPTVTESDLTHAGGNITISVKANIAYSLTPVTESWVRLSTQMQHKLIFTFAANNSTDERKTTLRFENSKYNYSATLDIVQPGRPTLVIEQTDYTVKNTGGIINIPVLSNADYDVTTRMEWIHIDNSRSMVTSQISLQINENTDRKSRRGYVSASIPGTTPIVITINQDGNGLNNGTGGIDDMPIENL